MNKTKHLSKRIMIICAIFSLLLSIAVGAIGFIAYYRGMVKHYENYLKETLIYCVSNIDADAVEYNIESGTDNTYSYADTQIFLNGYKTKFETIKYIYILYKVSDDPSDSMCYYMSGNTETDYEKGSIVKLGDSTEDQFDKEVTAHYIKFLNSTADIGRTDFYVNTTSFGTMLTGMKQVIDSEGRVVAVLSIDIEIANIKHVFLKSLLFIFVSAVILTAIFLIIEFRWMNNKIIKPIGNMRKSAVEFVDNTKNVDNPNELEFRNPEIHTGDEIQELSDSLIYMSEQMKSYMVNLLKQTENSARISAELGVANKIQKNMLPDIFPEYKPGNKIDIYALMNPAKEVGGDFYDFFDIDETHMAIVVADVSGKGVPAAMFMMIAKIIIRDVLLMGKDVGETLEMTNDQLCENNKESFFVTAWLGVLNTATGEVVYSNAGHNPPIITHEGKAHFMECDAGLVLGAMEGMPYDQSNFTLEKGDKLLLYTDGVPESINTDTVQYGEDRMIEMSETTYSMNNEEAVKYMKKDIEQFAGEEEQFDDITMLLLTYYGEV